MRKASKTAGRRTVGEMRPEYDFAGGVRGKHYLAFRQGYSVKIHHPDGTIVTQHYEPDEGAVVLDPDLREHFPTSEAVNRALRTLISGERPKAAKRARSAGKGRKLRG